MKKNLLEETGIMLLMKGFIVKTLTQTCFDLIARKQEQILLVKVLEDANAVSEEYAREMKKLSNYLAAASLIISEKAGQKLEDNIVYSRFGAYTLNINTFRNCLENKFPFIKRSQAGLTVKLDGEKLGKLIEGKGQSLASVARKIGVSRRMILKYESGQSEISLNKAVAMQKMFGNNIFDKINVFSSIKEKSYPSKSAIVKKYDNLGFEAAETKKVPFDVIAKKEKEIVLTGIGDKEHKHLKPISSLLETDKLIIFKKQKPRDIPALTKKEFLEFEKAKELIKFLKEFE